MVASVHICEKVSVTFIYIYIYIYIYIIYLFTYLFVTESKQVATSGRPKARDMYIGDARFEPWPGRYHC
jgi:hypothetical protein